MKIAAQALSGIVAAILLYLGARHMFTPQAVQSITALTPDNAFGASNIRAMGAPLIMLGIVTAIGAIKSMYEFMVPVALYFLALIVARIVTLVADGSDPTVIRALILAIAFFAVTEFAVQVIKRHGKAAA